MSRPDEVDRQRIVNDPERMHDRATDSPINSPEVVAVAASPAVDDAIVAVSSAAQPPIRYATDAEVDGAMEKIFQQHDRLLAELAK